MNSITFPAAILNQPFYDENWPASLNYGAFGLVAGHELTHGFDDQGVQWDGIGALSDWLSESSAEGFRNMADCVVNEYDGFCPLNGTGKVPACVNGDQTQGENIADNGGKLFRKRRLRRTQITDCNFFYKYVLHQQMFRWRSAQREE